jgi:phosphoribosylglycinamide formyltransferase-1
MKLAFLASHGGSNMQAVVDACRNGSLPAEPVLVISNNPEAQALDRARRSGVAACCLNARTHPGAESLDAAILDTLIRHGAELVVLAGYMKMIGPLTLACFHNRIINIHPALLPRHGGQGMYGLRVHAAVLAAKETTTGVTIHLVNGEYDSGRILAQSPVAVQEDDTPETLARRVLAEEHRLLVATLREIIASRIALGPN